MPIYMRYGSATKFIKGDVTEPAHKDWVELTSAQWGMGGGISESGFIVVTRIMDQTSEKLYSEAVIGRASEAVLDFVAFEKGKPQVYLRVMLTDTFISGFSISSGGVVSFVLSFKKLRYGYGAGTTIFEGVPPSLRGQ